MVTGARGVSLQEPSLFWERSTTVSLRTFLNKRIDDCVVQHLELIHRVFQLGVGLYQPLGPGPKLADQGAARARWGSRFLSLGLGRPFRLGSCVARHTQCFHREGAVSHTGSCVALFSQRHLRTPCECSKTSKENPTGQKGCCETECVVCASQCACESVGVLCPPTRKPQLFGLWNCTALHSTIKSSKKT